MPSQTKPSAAQYDICEFDYGDRRFTFRCWSDSDHVLRNMRRTNTFYELDVLECIKNKLDQTGRTGAAIDAGAFIGTHAVFFAGVCGLCPVLAFEPHPHSHSILVENVMRNGLSDKVLPLQEALSARNGPATLVEYPQNKGKSSIVETASGTEAQEVRMCTLDSVLADHPAGPVALLKIDVEGAEMNVLKGAKQTIQVHQPILCIEAHRYENLRGVLALLREQRYVPVDCLGWSPTYILASSSANFIKRLLATSIWLLRARLPEENARSREWLRQLGRRAGV